MAGLIFRAKFVIFLSTLSLRRATSAPAIKSCWSSYFYPRSPCGERLRVSVGDAHVCVISIHALLAESDQLLLDRGLTRDDISIHALLAESDTTFSGTVHRKEISIHALLAESDLCRCCVRSCSWHYFYPRSPCGERRGTYVSASPANVISIHALLAESDGQYPVTAMMCKIFLSTLSLRRATSGHLHTGALHKVFLSTLSLRRATIILRYSVSLSVFSIHALLAESDELVWCSSGGAFAFLSTLSLRRATGASHASSQSRRHFYPRSPCGERPWCISRSTPVQADFYPRSPCGERPANRKCLDFGWCISIHALLAESDSALAPKQNPTEHFYPRSPCGERQSMQDRPEEK